MDFWKNFPAHRLLAEASLWSANFACLGEEIRRVDEFVDLYHFDVSDAHFVPGLLFFPDLVAGLRPLTQKPFHAHLMVENPLSLIDDFARAGANLISVHAEIGPQTAAAVEKIRQAGCAAGLALGLDADLELALPHLEQIEMVVLLGTPLGVKGRDLSRLACARIQRLRALIAENGFAGQIKIEADGGIRANTVADLRAAGADLIVMGSLLFKSADLPQTFNRLHHLPDAGEPA